MLFYFDCEWFLPIKEIPKLFCFLYIGRICRHHGTDIYCKNRTNNQHPVFKFVIENINSYELQEIFYGMIVCG